MTCFEIGPPLWRGERSVFLCRRYVCCTVVSARVYTSCHGVPVTMDSVHPSFCPVNCCWPFPALSFLASGPVGTHSHIIVLSRLVRILKEGLRSEEGSGYYWSLRPLLALDRSVYCSVFISCHRNVFTYQRPPLLVPLFRISAVMSQHEGFFF
jgi:hypothetical protein